MKVLQDVDLSQATAMKEEIETMQQTLDEKRRQLTELLVNHNLKYYGSSPNKFYMSIHKEYCTEDGFFVKIESGNITISKKISENLTVIYNDHFNEYTYFNISHCDFVYDSGRCIRWGGQKHALIEKYAMQVDRFDEILKNEQVYNPFVDFSNYISFTDFY